MSDFVISIRAGEKLKPISLMRLTSVDDPDELLKDFDQDDIIIEPKYDGFKLQVIKTNGEFHIYTRRGKEKTDNFPYLISALENIPDNTFLEGELVYVYEKRQDLGTVTTLVNSSVETSIEKAKKLPGEVGLFFYDILWYKGKNVTSQPF